jgi:hypothetical protein
MTEILCRENKENKDDDEAQGKKDASVTTHFCDLPYARLVLICLVDNSNPADCGKSCVLWNDLFPGELDIYRVASCLVVAFFTWKACSALDVW